MFFDADAIVAMLTEKVKAAKARVMGSFIVFLLRRGSVRKCRVPPEQRPVARLEAKSHASAFQMPSDLGASRQTRAKKRCARRNWSNI